MMSLLVLPQQLLRMLAMMTLACSSCSATWTGLHRQSLHPRQPPQQCRSPSPLRWRRSRWGVQGWSPTLRPVAEGHWVCSQGLCLEVHQSLSPPALRGGGVEVMLIDEAGPGHSRQLSGSFCCTIRNCLPCIACIPHSSSRCIPGMWSRM